ncbi:hypothetical protein FQN57_000163 [Myotisia sp. PD_48]|nr:hypothetical protein FQN57_000163 [Myotisia sp. PD_48]
MFSWILFTALLIPTAYTLPNDIRCRCRPTEPCWPTEPQWNAFNRSVSGNLLAVKPVGAVCHDPTYNEPACWDVSALQWTNWEFGKTIKDSCFIQSPRGQPCNRGRISLFSVLARSVKDIQETVKFATKHNLRLVIRNTGHDFLGRSSAPDSLQISTSFLNSINFHDDFTAQGAGRGTRGHGAAVTVGAGVQFKDLYAAAGMQKLSVVGGFASTVGVAGGYIQGGGHSMLGPWKGMAVDHALEFKVVTAKGLHVIANQYQNSDLFWALRGGGGGTFGVVTSVTLKAHPDAPLVAVQFDMSRPSADEVFWACAEAIHAHMPSVSDEGGSGYFRIIPKMTPNSAVLTIRNYFIEHTDIAPINEIYSPLMAALERLTNQTRLVTISAEPSISGTYETVLPEVESTSGVNVALGSRLLSRSLLESDTGPRRLSRALSSLPPLRQAESILVSLVAGGAVAKNTRSKTALHPAWDKALVHIVVTRLFGPNATDAAVDEFYKSLTQKDTAALRSLEPGSMGAYYNEADPNEKDFAENFWGADNYERLKRVKSKWDPKDLFIVRKGVGSERWDDSGFCRSTWFGGMR